MFQNTPLSDLSAFMSLYFGSPLADDFRTIADFNSFLLWKRRRNRVGTPHFFFCVPLFYKKQQLVHPFLMYSKFLLTLSMPMCDY